MQRKKVLMFLVILLSVAVIGLSGTYAYYVAVVEGSGNTSNNQTNVTTIDLGSIYYEGETVFTGSNMYPGKIAVQEFKIGPQGDTGVGIFEIDLHATLPEEFGSDVKIRLYKTTDPENDYMEVVDGVLTQTGNQFYKQDIINIKGNPELIYETISLIDSPNIILDIQEFNVETLNDTTYYLVYEYLNNGNQDAQQGLQFSGKVTVKLIRDIPFSKKIIDYNGTTAASLVANASLNTTSIATDDPQSNPRFIGSNPNNYVDIGDNSLWRIIGSFDMSDGTTTTKHLKITRATDIGQYAFDYNPEDGSYSIDWDNAYLQDLLNKGFYWTRGKGTCYSMHYGNTVDCDFSSTGLTEKAKSYIDSVNWIRGGTTTNDIGSAGQYANEISGTPSAGSGIWNGKIGLMYITDYSFATTGGATTSRDTCLNVDLYTWHDADKTDCKKNSWLFHPTEMQWTFTGTPDGYVDYQQVVVGNEGSTYFYNMRYDAWPKSPVVRPTAYLQDEVRIVSGEGTQTNPYKISM